MNDIKLPPVPSLIAERDWHEAFKQYGRDTLLLNQKPEKKLWPQQGDPYWLLLADGKPISRDQYEPIIQDERLNQGNIFPTKEAAIKERDRRIVMQRLRVLAGEVDLHVNKTLATIYHSKSGNEWRTTLLEPGAFPGTVYFNTEQEAREAIVVIGVDELNKLLP